MFDCISIISYHPFFVEPPPKNVDNRLYLFTLTHTYEGHIHSHSTPALFFVTMVMCMTEINREKEIHSPKSK